MITVIKPVLTAQYYSKQHKDVNVKLLYKSNSETRTMHEYRNMKFYNIATCVEVSISLPYKIHIYNR